MTEALLREAQMAFDVAHAEALLAAGDKGGSEAYVDQILAQVGATMAEAFQPAMFDILVQSADSEAEAFNEEGGFRTADAVGFAFNKSNPEAILWAQKQSMQLVKYISEEGRQNLRVILADAWANGIPIAEAARRMRSELMLAPNAAAALANFRTKLLDNPGKLVVQGGLRYRVPKGGMSAEALAKATARYEAKLRRTRAENIARTETVAASNEGQRQLWLQGAAKGYLGPNDKRKWLAAPNACPICIPMNGQLRSLNQPFLTGNGRAVMGPPAHSSCRCGQGLVLATDKPAAQPSGAPGGAARGWQRVAHQIHRWDSYAVENGAWGPVDHRHTADYMKKFNREMDTAEKAISAEVDRMLAEFQQLAGLAEGQSKVANVHVVYTHEWTTKVWGSPSRVAGLYNSDFKDLYVATNRTRNANKPFLGGWSISEREGWLATFRHEYGHHMWFHGLPNSNALYVEWDAITSSLSRAEMATLVSQYAATNGAELFAESFSAWTSADYGKLGRLPRSIEEFMEKLFGKRVTP